MLSGTARKQNKTKNNTKKKNVPGKSPRGENEVTYTKGRQKCASVHQSLFVKVNVPKGSYLGRVPKSPREVSPPCLVPASLPRQIMKSLGETTLALWPWPQEAHEPLTHIELVKSVPGIRMPPTL